MPARETVTAAAQRRLAGDDDDNYDNDDIRYRQNPNRLPGIKDETPQPYQGVQNPRPTTGPYLPGYHTYEQPQASNSRILPPYASPSPSIHSSSNTQPTFSGSGLTNPVRHHSDAFTYYGAHPAPYTAASTSGYASTDTTADNMAATHAMRPPMTSAVYGTPQSNSPASVHSPQEIHGRPPYSHSPQHGSFYGPYIPTQQASYAYYPGTSQHASYPYAYSSGHQLQHQPPPRQNSSVEASPRSSYNPGVQRFTPQMPRASFPPTTTAVTAGGQRQNSQVATSQSPAPGPIPATTPTVVKTDAQGVVWIMFEYSRDRMKVQYEIRCDTESVDVKTLSDEYRNQNAVYPRAQKPQSEYSGNRYQYETECNEVGWALSWLNPVLRGKRGLIQRAVDSWRNSHKEDRFRSRRVRRMQKNKRRQATQQAAHLGSQSLPSTAATSTGPLGISHATSDPSGSNDDIHHHHIMSQASATEADYPTAGQQYKQQQNATSLPPATDARPAHNFYPSYPVQPTLGSSQLVPQQAPMAHLGPGESGHDGPVVSEAPQTGHTDQGSAIFGNLPYTKALRKHVTVADKQKGTNVRVNFKLDESTMDEIPDTFRYKNSVFPRSYYARQTQSPPLEDEEDVEGSSEIVKTNVLLELEAGFKTELIVPKIRKLRRNRERALNDLGCHLTWGQTQYFADRPLFLQQALNKCRTEISKRFKDSEHEVPEHFETRPGKRKWQSRAKSVKRRRITPPLSP